MCRAFSDSDIKLGFDTTIENGLKLFRYFEHELILFKQENAAWKIPYTKG